MLVGLTRTVRFCVNDPPRGSAPRAEAATEAVGSRSAANGFGGRPAMAGLGRYYELDVRCAGAPDPVTGYLVNIKDVDVAARRAAIPIVELACRTAPSTEPGEIVGTLIPRLDAELGGIVTGVTWRLTPTYSVSAEKHDMGVITIRQRFDFAASHRLHVESLSDDDNRRIFGKCNNPSGHGHNYQVEPAVDVRLDESGRLGFSLAQLEALTDRCVVERFDHKHLNTDTSEFSGAGGVNPSVEHIAAVCYELLAEPVRVASAGVARLRAVTVWETDRTCAVYEGGAAVEATGVGDRGRPA